MKLTSKLNSIQRSQVVDELDKLLTRDNIQISLSWFGRRLVSVNGYEGKIPFDYLLLKFLKATEFQFYKFSDQETKRKCIQVWNNKIKPINDEFSAKIKVSPMVSFMMGLAKRDKYKVEIPLPSKADLRDSYALKLKVSSVCK